jgi:hypothetical protein
MKKRNKAFLFFVYLLLFSIVLLGSKCKKDNDEVPPDDPPTITCTSNILDGCLDDWKVIHTNSGDYINPTADFLQTLNELASLPAAAGGPGPVTCDTVTDCVQGKYAARLISKSFSPMGNPIFIPGYVGVSKLDIPNGTIHLGNAYTLRPKKLLAYYKYAPVSGDSGLIQIMLSKYNAGLRDTISFDKVIVKNPVTSYTQLDLTLSYRDTINTPDTLVILFLSSGGFDFSNLIGGVGQVNSTMWVDDLKFVFP